MKIDYKKKYLNINLMHVLLFAMTLSIFFNSSENWMIIGENLSDQTVWLLEISLK